MMVVVVGGGGGSFIINPILHPYSYHTFCNVTFKFLQEE